MMYYLFDNDKIDNEITEYFNTATEQGKTHYTDYYGDYPPIAGAVYVRLCREKERRKKSGYTIQTRSTRIYLQL